MYEISHLQYDQDIPKEGFLAEVGYLAERALEGKVLSAYEIVKETRFLKLCNLKGNRTKLNFRTSITGPARIVSKKSHIQIYGGVSPLEGLEKIEDFDQLWDRHKAAGDIHNRYSWYNMLLTPVKLISEEDLWE